MFAAPLFAFGFESLPMLGWLAAAAAPWLIHLLTRRKHRETPWAAIDFLIAAVKRRSRKIRLEQLLLLLLRTLVIATVVTAVAEPYVERVGTVFSTGGSTHRVLVIDSSYSMAYKPGDRSRFEQAKQWAAQIVEHSAPGDGFTLIQMADPPTAIVSTPALEAEPVRQEIENLELLHTGADVPATVAEVGKLLDAARRDSPRLTRAEVYIFTDMQRASWMPGGNAARAELRSRAAELSAVARLHVIDLGQPDVDNLAVTSLELRAPYVLADRGGSFTATLRDFGHTGRKRQTVDLLVDRQMADRKYVDVPADGETTVPFHYRFATPGEHAVEVRATGDNLEVDNRRYLVVNVRQALRVLCIDGRPAGDPTKASVFELSHALLSQSHPGERPPIKIQLAPQSAVAERELSNYDCVAFSNVAQFTAGEARLLDNYLDRGGNLVFFLGDRVRAENYNRILADPARPILPARLLEVAKNTAGRLDPLDYHHPILEKFRGHPEVDLPHSFVEFYFKVKLLEAAAPGIAGDSSSDLARDPPQVALAIGNRDPLIVARPVRHGRVVLVTTSADNSWQLLEAGGNYEPLVKGILDWCLAGQAKPRNVFVGDALESSFDKAAGAVATASASPSAASAVSIERPDGHRATVPVIRGDDRTWTYDDTRISGIYSAQLGPPSGVQLFAVNLKTSESDLTRLSRDELQDEVLPGVSLDYQTAWQAGAARLTLPEGSAGQLHVVLLYAAAALLLLETVLAWRLGNNPR
jgi:hypothetical protein